MWNSNSRAVVASSLSFSLLAARAPGRACSQATLNSACCCCWFCCLFQAPRCVPFSFAPSPLSESLEQATLNLRPPFWLLTGAKKLVFFWHQSEARTAATIWNWSGKTLSPGVLLAVLYFSSFHIYFSAHVLDFLSSRLSAPGSPKMGRWSSTGIIKKKNSHWTVRLRNKRIICKVVTYRRWSLTRRGRHERVDCITLMVLCHGGLLHI